jgi:head-tail adaptor
MRLGMMNTLCRVERQEPDLGLGLPRKWKATGKKAWFSVEQLTGMELIAAQQLEARANLQLKTHWQADIKPSDRLVTETKNDESPRVFNIVAANNDKNQNRELVLTCIEVVKS